MVVWGGFRYFFDFGDAVTELWFKPVLWLVPLFWWNASMKNRVKFFGSRSFYSLVVGLIIGVFYWLIIKRSPGFNFDLDLLGVVFVTAVVEELTFSGFVAGYLEKIKSGSFLNILVVGVMVMLVRVPILIFDYKIGISNLVGALMFVMASGMINAWIRVKTGSISGSILARMGMSLAVL